ncbi:hypothetical protein SAY86_015409 [Trapa natans]|uniref:Protein kinase domain-containing protein n=1 Tax=Trapa natans TaxID=22666 RepID=A0AAN7QH94_TRANT|nr:hypothetical protein SAY86_015409 [Trapa natans]
MGGECGFDSSSASPICMCGGLVCSVTVSRRIGHLAGVVVAVGAAAVLILVVFFNRKSSLNIKVCDHVNGENRADVEAFIAVHGSLAPKRYRYWEVKKMTNSFSEKLGKGGYGVVYKGQLGEYGRNVAVKVLTESKGNIEDFLNEVASISRTAHVNVITLLGFCYEGKKRALIYEFMFNGSLDKFIRNREASDASGPFLEWNILYRIAIGIARGLEYLHQGCSTRILHFDIKPQNILLDENFSPKISDFGLAKLCKQRESIVSMLEMRGTVGYIAPEVFSRNFGGVSHKSDVYSYGMLVLDMVGGRNKSNSQVSQSSESYFPDSIFKHIEEVEGIRALGTTSEEEEEAVRKMVLVGLWCIQIHPSCRPSMKEVIEMLEGSSHNLEVPPKPYLSSPVRSPKNSSFTSSDFISRSLNVEISPILQES